MMFARSHRSVWLAGLSAFTLAAPALAQEGESEAGETETIVVRGTPIRDSQAAAIEAKRTADNVLDVISADTIGRFPDQNLADSLGRLPGVAIERDQGQARFINFRGAPFRWTSIAFDGVDVLGAENGRVPRFDSFPSVITSAVEANKAITPDMPGEAVAGFINIKTFDPFAREGFAFSGEAGVGEQELGGGPISKYNLRASWSNDRLGALIFGSHNRREQVTDNREFDLEVDGNGDLVVNGLDFRSYIVEREDNAYGGKLEFRPEGAAVERVFVSSLFSEFIDREQRNQWVVNIADGAGAIGGAVAPGAIGYQPLVLVDRLLEDGRYSNSTWTSTLGADFDLGGWRAEGRLNYTETTNDINLPIPFSAAASAAASYDLTNVDRPQLSLFAPFSETPIALSDLDYAVDLALLVDGALDTQSVKAKIDLERDGTLFGRDATTKIGAQIDQREADGYGFTIAVGGFPSSVDIDAFDTGRAWPTDFYNTIGGTVYDNPGLRDAWAAAVGGLSTEPGADQLIAIEEDIYSAYAMTTTLFDGGNLVLGARVEWADYTSAGPALETAYSNDYVTFLPSAHLNLDLAEDVKGRLSFTTGVTRPTYTELRASADVDPTNELVIGGNPTLDAERSWGADASLEWYFASASLLSAGAFVRFVDNVIYADSSTIDAGVYFPPAAGEDWTLIGPFNGDNGRLSGLEFNAVLAAAEFLPAPFDGFGASGNLTILDSEFETRSGATFSLPGTSSLLYNASVFYEKFGLSARLNYQYRDAWLSTTENDSLAEFWDEQERWDASVRYALPAAPGGLAFTLFADGNNLSNAVDVRYLGQRSTPNQVEGFGRHYVVGLRADF